MVIVGRQKPKTMGSAGPRHERWGGDDLHGTSTATRRIILKELDVACAVQCICTRIWKNVIDVSDGLPQMLWQCCKIGRYGCLWFVSPRSHM